jgi:hypothetical protein
MLVLCRTLQCRLPLQRPRGCGIVRAMSRAVLAGRSHAESLLVVELRARIADKDKVVADKDSELRARIAEKDKVIADKDKVIADKDSELVNRIAGKDEVIASCKEVFAQAVEAHAKEAEKLRYDADLALGRVSVRAVLEACIEDVAKSHGGSLSGAPRSQQLQRLVAKGGCEGLQSYLRVAAFDNNLKEDDLLKQAPALYGALSGSLHAEGTGGTTSAPAALFDPHGRTKMVAMAAIARFTGRNLNLYAAARDPRLPPIKLRVLSPLQRSNCALTVDEVLAASVVEA